MELSDEVLVLACRQGDASAWEALMARYQRLIYSIAHRASLDTEQSADVLQRVFMTLVERLDQIERPALIGAWLVTTAPRAAWRVRRREMPTAAAADDLVQPFGLLPADGLLPEELLLRLEEQHRIRAAVAALDERCGKLLTWLFYRPDPPSYEQIAAALGVREGSIGPTRARCLQKLRRLLDDFET
jgi:RNA polymerase sigma factor (sigma-70 family)